MPTRKQRRRREKTFRHEYGFVTYDEEGNEVEVDQSQVREKKKAEKPKPAAASRKGGRGAGRAGRVPPKPSWGRSLRRSAPWGAAIFVVIVFFFNGNSLASRLILGLMYAVAFVPLTYWVDRLVYRNYQRRLERQ
jgi:hypothetical protein